MDSYDIRLRSAEQFRGQLIEQSIEQPFEQAVALWREGYSTRIIQEITGVHRSKISRYVNEHDCFSDITSATNDGFGINVRDRGSYVQKKTVANNTYGSTYTFYCFPDSNSDPFGDTSETKRQEIGDFCYRFEDL